MPSLPLTWLDVFTAEPLAGNQLAVVHDADALDADTMLAFARETTLSETTFLQPPSGPAAGATYRNRIFWMNGEMPFAGHPSLGTAVAHAAHAGAGEAAYVQETIAGHQPVTVTFTGERTARASMHQEPAAFGPQVDPPAVAAAAGLPVGALDESHPPQVVSTGVAHVLAPLRAGADLAGARPDVNALRPLLDAHDAAVLYLAVVDPTAGTAQARGFFVNPGGLAEDPATGSAAGPLMAHTAAWAGIGALTVTQGVAMGRPSELRCAVDGERVTVAGDVVIVAQGTVHLPG